jgi:membrane-bound ClpP family serine protease
MGNLSHALINGAVILLVATLAALLMHLVTPGGGLLGVVLWAVFFITLLYFPPQECASKIKSLWKRG